MENHLVLVIYGRMVVSSRWNERLLLSMAIIAGSYEGIELIGISAGEVANPQEAIVKSVKSVLWRYINFFTLEQFLLLSPFIHGTS